MTNTPPDVVISGLGPVTAIGVGCDALWSSLTAGRCQVGKRRLAVDIGRAEELVIAGMPGVDQVEGLAPHLQFLNEQGCSAHRDLAYTLLAIELALADAGLEFDRADNNIGVIQAFEAPGVEQTVSTLFSMMSSPLAEGGPMGCYEMLAPHFYNAQPFVYVHLIGKALGLHGYSTSVHNACSSGAFALEQAARRIQSGQAEVMIVAGGEAFETAVRLEWFRRLDLYAGDAEAMRPFDPESKGFYVGEGGAAIVLESADHAARRGARPYARYAGGAFAQQSWKQSIPDARAGRLTGVIRNALDRAEVSPGDIDLIVPHGASTPLSDGYEAASLTEALGQDARRAVATVFKPYMGHMLAASGIVEVIGAVLAIKHQFVPATPRSRPDEGRLPVPLMTESAERHVDTILKLSTGFTGHDAAIMLTRHD